MDTPYLYQESFRRREQRFIRFTLTWKFGEQNTSLFRKRSSKHVHHPEPVATVVKVTSRTSQRFRFETGAPDLSLIAIVFQKAHLVEIAFAVLDDVAQAGINGVGRRFEE